MKTIRVLVFCDGCERLLWVRTRRRVEFGCGCGAPVRSVLNRKAAPTKQEVVPTDKYPFAALQKSLEQGPGTEISSEIGSQPRA